MRSKRALIIIPLSLLLLILMGITSFAKPHKQIVGTWVSQTNPDYKLEFSKNGVCKYYYVGKEYKKCAYHISSAYNKTNENRSLIIEMSDENGEMLDYYELKDMNENNNDILVLGDIEKGEEYLYDKVLN
ncbi:hypothetical protein [Kordia jejudonensis]|uniref:hypothetical protein n=1 Tax=Kordia jejudonensis TaxID=1348245 RepID=UPI00062964D3|nr:hypothetical protein [Kordia jejudonensis]